ncbi:MAG: hypothetical protein AAB628_00910 [Patescibacteria group bacterium]
MKSCIIGTGEPSRVRFSGASQIAQPFIGVSGEKEEFSIAGILFKKKEPIFTVLSNTFSIFHMWRVMKLLEMVKRLDNTTVMSCYEIVDRKDRNVYSPECADIFLQLGGPKNLYKLRGDLLASAPPVENIEDFILALAPLDTEIDLLELKSEISLCNVQITPIISKTLGDWKGFSKSLKMASSSAFSDTIN